MTQLWNKSAIIRRTFFPRLFTHTIKIFHSWKDHRPWRTLIKYANNKFFSRLSMADEPTAQYYYMLADVSSTNRATLVKITNNSCLFYWCKQATLQHQMSHNLTTVHNALAWHTTTHFGTIHPMYLLETGWPPSSPYKLPDLPGILADMAYIYVCVISMTDTFFSKSRYMLRHSVTF